MYEKFTDRARKVMQLANQEAQYFKHEYIGTEHILLGLVKEGSGVAANVFKNLDIDLRKIRLEVEKIVQSGPDMVTMGKLPQTPRAKKVIEYSIEEARGLNHTYVGTEHLLLGLIREEEGVASQVLMSLGLRLQDIRNEVLNILGHDLESSHEPTAVGSQQKPSKTPALDSFGQDLTALALDGKLTRLVGREKEIEQVLLVMSCSTRRNPLLVGENGVGKRALVEGLAQRAVENKWTEVLRDKRIVAVNLAHVALQTLERGKFEEALNAMFSELGRVGNIVLFLEDFSDWVHANAILGGVQLIALLNSVLAAELAQCIGATTPSAYRAQGAEDSLLGCHFQPVFVNPPSREEILEILRARRPPCETYHRVKIADDALEAALEMSAQHAPHGVLPGKAFQLLDQAGAFVRLAHALPPPEAKELERQLEQLNRERENAVAEIDFPKAAELRDQGERLKRRLEALVQEWQKSIASSFGVVDRATVAVVVAKMAGR